MEIIELLIVILPVIFFVIGFFIGKNASHKVDGYLHIMDGDEDGPILLLDIQSYEAIKKPIVTLKTLKGETRDDLDTNR